MTEKTYISGAALIWIWLLSGGPMVGLGVFLALYSLNYNVPLGDIIGIFTRALSLALAVALPVASIAYFKLFWAQRNPETKQRFDEYWRKLSSGKDPPKRFSLRFLLAYMACFFAIIPFGILLSLLGIMHFYVGFASYFVFIPLTYVTSRRVLIRAMYGSAPSELAMKESKSSSDLSQLL